MLIIWGHSLDIVVDQNWGCYMEYVFSLGQPEANPSFVHHEKHPAVPAFEIRVQGIHRRGCTDASPILPSGYVGYHQKGLCKGYVLEWNKAQNLQKRRKHRYSILGQKQVLEVAHVKITMERSTIEIVDLPSYNMVDRSIVVCMFTRG